MDKEYYKYQCKACKYTQDVDVEKNNVGMAEFLSSQPCPLCGAYGIRNYIFIGKRVERVVESYDDYDDDCEVEDDS